MRRLARDHPLGQIAADLNSRPQDESHREGHEVDGDQDREHAEGRHNQGRQNDEADPAKHHLSGFGQADVQFAWGLGHGDNPFVRPEP